MVVQSKVAEVKKVRQDLTVFFNQAVKLFGQDAIIHELMVHRKYSDQRMFDCLKALGMFKVDYLSELTVSIPNLTNERLRQWGVINEHGDFLLGGRYVVPIRSISGQVMALVGWHPKGGARKYVTTPTVGFSRDISFFNLDCYQHAWDKWNGTVYLVEGIFDTIALRSLGFAALGDQGLEMSHFKSIILSRFGKVVAIPDNDKAGRSVHPFLNKYSGKGEKFVWKIDNEWVFVTLPDDVKDVDDFVTNFECYDDLLACQSAHWVKKLKED